jgi:hypothetical protein
MIDLRRFGLAAGLFVAVLVSAASSSAEGLPLAISGYDPVAYFTDGKPVPGLAQFEHVWHDLRWRFASSEHRAAFSSDPLRYAPQYDGFCALGVAFEKGHKDTVDPEAWAIVEGKLFLAHDRHWLDVWREKAGENIVRAGENWVAVKDQTAIYNGYPNLQKQ